MVRNSILPHLIVVIDYFRNESIGQFSEWLNDEKYEIKILNKGTFSSRVLNHWEKMKLIPLSNNRKKFEWRTFNIIEIVWLFIIVKLREGGMPLEKIREVRKAICNQSDLENTISNLPEDIREVIERRFGQTSNPFLECAVFRIFFLKEPIFLTCHLEGGAELLSHNHMLLKINQGEITDHTSVFVNQIVQSLFPKKDLTPEYQNLSQIGSDLVKLFGLIYNSKATKVEIRMKDGKIKRVDLTRVENPESNLRDLLMKSDYQDITISTEKGEKKVISRTEKIMF